MALVVRYLPDLAEITERRAKWATDLVVEWHVNMAEPVPAWDALEDIARRADPRMRS